MEIRENNGIRYYEGDVTPGDNVVFVFGSNPQGRHGAGAAKIAREQFGAVYGQGEGLQGNSYALPTKDLRVKERRSLRSISPETITESIKAFYRVAAEHPDREFCIAYRNTEKASLNGYTGLEMIEMFNAAGPMPGNIVVSKEWADTGLLQKKAESEYLTEGNEDILKQYDAYRAIAPGVNLAVDTRMEDTRDWFELVDDKGNRLVRAANYVQELKEHDSAHFENAIVNPDGSVSLDAVAHSISPDGEVETSEMAHHVSFTKEELTEMVKPDISDIRVSLGQEIGDSSAIGYEGPADVHHYEVLDENKRKIGTVIIENYEGKRLVLHPELTVTHKGYGQELYQYIADRYQLPVWESFGLIGKSDDGKKLWDSLQRNGVTSSTFDGDVNRRVIKPSTPDAEFLVRNDDGTPKLLWHGSSKVFDKFDFSHAGENTGLVEYTDKRTGEKVTGDADKTLFFTDNRELAISYAFLARTDEQWAINSYLTDIVGLLNGNTIIVGSIKNKADLAKAIDFLKKEGNPDLDAILAQIDATQEKPISRLPEEQRKKMAKALVGVRETFAEYLRMNDRGGLSNRLNNFEKMKRYLPEFKRDFERLCANDASVLTEFGDDFNEHIMSFFEPRNHGVIIALDRKTGKMMAHYDGKHVALDTLDTAGKVALLDRIDRDLNACIEEFNKDIVRAGFAQSTHLYPVNLKAKNPLVHDYQGSSFPDKYKPNEKYLTAYIAARQVKKALADGNDMVVYKNVTDPFLGTTYGVFSNDSIVMVDRKKIDKSLLEPFIEKVPENDNGKHINMDTKESMKKAEQQDISAVNDEKIQKMLHDVHEYEKKLKGNLDVRYKSAEEYYYEREDDWDEIRYKAFETTIKDAKNDHYPKDVMFEWAMMHVAEMKSDEKQINAAIKCEMFFEPFLTKGNERKLLRDFLNKAIGTSDRQIRITGDVEIDVYASDTRNYVVSGIHYDKKQTDYIVTAYRGYPFEDDEPVFKEIAVRDMDIEDVDALLTPAIVEQILAPQAEKAKQEATGMKPLSEDEMRQTVGETPVVAPEKPAQSGGMKPLTQDEMKSVSSGVEVQKEPVNDAFRRIAEAAVASGKVKSVGNLKDGWALVEARNGKFNYANAEGKFMARSWFDKASEFKEGQAVVLRDGNKITIDNAGIIKKIVPGKEPPKMKL